MVHWKLLCGVAALYAAADVKAASFAKDPTETRTELVMLDGHFPGYGGFREKDDKPTPVTRKTRNGGTEYKPGRLHPSLETRRLEETMSADMQKLESYFGGQLEIDITKLPTKAEGRIPWPGSYWPVFADSINYRWKKGQPSPAEKYALAFDHDPTTLMDTISAQNGIDSMTKRHPCTVDAECKPLKDSSVCAKRNGSPSGYCIPRWFGICHAWAPASILEDEPACTVERNGVVFEPYDIKALITLAYDGSKIPTIFTGTRFNGDDRKDNTTDEYGRYVDNRRRDLSPGFFHIAIANVMGILNSSFVVDITAGNEVWNQPVRSYEILRFSWTTPSAAARRFFNVETYPFNDDATRIAVVTTRLSWVVESGVNGPLVSTGQVNRFTKSADYEYCLEIDDEYRILGGEWLAGAMRNHPDFIWLPASKPDNSSVTPVGLVYGEIESLVIESTSGDCVPVTPGNPVAPTTSGGTVPTTPAGPSPVGPVTDPASPLTPPASPLTPPGDPLTTPAGPPTAPARTPARPAGPIPPTTPASPTTPVSPVTPATPLSPVSPAVPITPAAGYPPVPA